MSIQARPGNHHYDSTIALDRHKRRWDPDDVKRTPAELFDALDAEFGFTLDVCALADNTLCSRYFDPQTNGLWQSWGTECCWMNPPFSEIARWMQKAREAATAGATVVALVPVRSDLGWWHDIAMTGEIRFIRKRVRFDGMSSTAPFPVAIVIFRPTDEVPA